VARASRSDAITSAVLALGALRHYGWQFADDGLRGEAWKACSAACILGLAWMHYLERPSQYMAAVIAWLAFEELQVLICAAWWAADPWPVPDGCAVCSARAGIDIGAIGILLVALLVWRVAFSKGNV